MLTRRVRSPTFTRRDWLKTLTAASVLTSALPAIATQNRAARSFHVCLSPAIVESDPALLTIVREAGVRTVWLVGFLYSTPFSVDLLGRARARVERAGLEAQVLNVPLGHPSDAPGPQKSASAIVPSVHRQVGQRPDGKLFAGTSLHPPATTENVEVLRGQRQLGFQQCFLDDDFRLARSPGEIGGCFCDAHRDRFLRAGGYAAGRWAELCEDVRVRRLSPLLRAWLTFTCDELTVSFRAQQRAFRRRLGIMVMYLGAEKAGIRLRDYRNMPFRVGELMFDDRSFAPIKGKTDELFSVLFHRRFTEPERAFSETTAAPHDRLNATNMAAKLIISTIADVRQTMFMSGLIPFPREHWDVLGPAMRQQAQMHAELAGHYPRGPFKQFWGEAQRWVGDDQPFSLWLAAGVPFELIESPVQTGWTFLSDFDARELVAQPDRTPARFVCRPSAASHPPTAEIVGETLAELFAFKNRIKDKLRDVPHVTEDEPAVCAWYPTARKVLVWNLSEQPRTLTVVLGPQRRTMQLGPLAAAITEVPAKTRPAS